MPHSPPTPPIEAPREPDWPAARDERVVFLLDASNGIEERRLRDWIDRQRPAGLAASEVEVMQIPASRRRRGRLDPRLERLLATGEDPLLAPLRVVWLAPVRGRRRSAGLSDLLRLGDPRDPGPLRARWAARRHPERCRIVAGEPARASELRDRWRAACGADAAQTLGLAEFVARQAALALERGERRLRGARYKVPRFVHDDILARPAFRGSIARLARETGRSERRVAREAERDLREIAANHSTFVIDLVTQLWRSLFSRGYGQLRYDPAELERLSALGQRHPVVFLPSHKSNLDHPVLQLLLHENGLPPNHTAGGINMNFFPIGPLVRRSGVFFIRRSFKDDPVYKFVLSSYIDYLIEKRFPLEWYIEGGRSRSGKLLPPRFGMLAYVVDSFRRAKAEDVQLVPVSIAYDQISDVGDYAAEAGGAAKERESFGWFVRFIRRLNRQYGDIEIRFGEPVSLAQAVGAPDPEAEPNPDEKSLELQKLAFEVCVRINQVTPVTPTSLITLALLGRGSRALSVAEMQDALRNLLDYARIRKLPATDLDDLETAEGVGRNLDRLVANGVLTCFSEGPEPVYAIGANQHLAAAYYRNTVIHFFLVGAIAELALLRAAEPEVGNRRQTFWDDVLELRDLLKFEFFFPEKEAFLTEVRQEMSLHDAAWESRLDADGTAIQGLFPSIRPYAAHRVLRPFLEAYRVVADALEREPVEAEIDEKAFLERCLALGKQYVLQGQIRRQESVSKLLFANALRLARNRDLTTPGAADLAERRAAFASDLRFAIRRVEMVEALVRLRHAGLME